MSAETQDEWFPIPQAFPLLRRYFRSEKTLRHHLWRRDRNGLAAMDAVRRSPLGMLLVNVARVERWAQGEGQREAA